MKSNKYYYNKATLRYEKIEVNWKQKLLKLIGFVSAAITFALIIVVFAFKYLESPKEKRLLSELTKVEQQYTEMDKKLEQYFTIMADLQERDDNTYRTIFEAEPIPANIRTQGYGGSERFQFLENLPNSKLLTSISKKMEQLGRLIYVQSKSYDEIADMIENKEKMLAHLPAIQPINNKNLTRIASGYGYRIDPILKIRKFHYGIDFTAPSGTDVYVTGRGTVSKVGFSRKRGYGNHIVVDHGFNYKTLYAHLSKIHVKKGDDLDRGDIIGEVGDTGKSTAPHLHYEVMKNGNKINPVNFFYNDLSPEEYDRVIEIANSANQSFD